MNASRVLSLIRKHSDPTFSPVLTKHGASYTDVPSGRALRLPDVVTPCAAVNWPDRSPMDESAATGVQRRGTRVLIAAQRPGGGVIPKPESGDTITLPSGTFIIDTVTPWAQRGLVLVYEARLVA